MRHKNQNFLSSSVCWAVLSFFFWNSRILLYVNWLSRSHQNRFSSLILSATCFGHEVVKRGDITSVQREVVLIVRKRTWFGQDRSCFNFQHRRVKLQETSPDCLIGWKVEIDISDSRFNIDDACMMLYGILLLRMKELLTWRLGRSKGPCPRPSCGKPTSKRFKRKKKLEDFIGKILKFGYSSRRVSKDCTIQIRFSRHFFILFFF